MFSKMYEEKHFMRNRKVSDYSVKQATSCLFLIKRLEDLLKDYGKDSAGDWDRGLELLVMCLTGTHKRQVKTLNGNYAANIPTVSFYHDLMLSRLSRLHQGGTFSDRVAAMYAVMYERGRLRYQIMVNGPLYGGPKPWDTLLVDAEHNRELCVNYLIAKLGKREATSLIRKVSKEEEEIVREIDKRNSEKE